jgi:hypothetical protein
MFACTHESPPRSLELPDAFEDLTGIVASDLKVIVGALTRRAGERMLLSGRQRQELQRTLWNNLTQALAQSLEPFDVERQ